MNNRLFVGNLSWNSSEDSLRDAFSKAGEVVSVNVITDRMSGRSKGFGFVEMATDENATAAIEMWNDKEIDGRSIKVSVARPREERA